MSVTDVSPGGWSSPDSVWEEMCQLYYSIHCNLSVCMLEEVVQALTNKAGVEK